MNILGYPLMITLFFAMSQGQNHYTQSSIDALLANLAKYQRIHIKRRWLFSCLRRLLDDGYINRKPRYQHDSSGHISQIPSLITFTLKGVVRLVAMGVDGAKAVYRSMMTYLKKGDKRWPSRTDFDDGTYFPENEADRERLKRLVEIVATRI